MITEVCRIFRIRPQILLDVIMSDLLKRVILRGRQYVWNRQRQCGYGRDDNFHSASARRAAVKEWLRGDLIRRKLGLQMRAVLVKAGDDGENDRGSEHQPSEECEIRVRA